MSQREIKWPKMENEMKIKNLERLLKAITGARKIRYIKYPMGDGRIELVDIYVEDIKFAREDQGLEVDFVPEPPFIDQEVIDERKQIETRIDAWVYFWENPWDTIDKLKKELERGAPTKKEETE